jgi:hypothetical protein
MLVQLRNPCEDLYFNSESFVHLNATVACHPEDLTGDDPSPSHSFPSLV